VAICALSEFKFKMADNNDKSKNNRIIIDDEIEKLCALEKTHEIMHRGKESNVCSDEERIVRQYSFLKSNEEFMEDTQQCLIGLQRDSAVQIPNPAVVYRDPVKQLLSSAEGIVQ
jgi:UTP-glucose-1-phosphate uridylyltransferase